MTDRNFLPLHPPPQNPNDLRNGDGDAEGEGGWQWDGEDGDAPYEHDTQTYEIWIPFNGRRDDDFTVEIDADGNQTGIIKFYRPDVRELQQSVTVRLDHWPVRGGMGPDQLEAEAEAEASSAAETRRPRPEYRSPEEIAESRVARQAEKQRQIDEASIRARVNTPD